MANIKSTSELKTFIAQFSSKKTRHGYTLLITYAGKQVYMHIKS